MPYPPVDGGAIATLNMLTEFANQGHKVDVLAMQTYKHSFSIEKLPQELLVNITWNQVFVNTQLSPVKALVNLLFSKEPYNAVRFDCINYRNKLVEVLEKNTYDIIQLEGLYLSTYIKTIRKQANTLVSLRAHNVEWRIWERLAISDQSFIKSLYYRILAKRVKRMELNTLKQIDLLVPITENDKLELPIYNSNNIFVAPTGIKKENLLQKEPDNIKTLFHIGALDWIPNQEGLLWFVENVWQKIKLSFPEWEFIIAGRNAPLQFQKELGKYPVKYIGQVDSAKDFIDKNGIMIVPLLAGSGMRIKIIEGMARSKAIVTTSIGAEGIPVTNMENIIIADNIEEMYSAISDLMNNFNQLKSISNKAFSFVKENFNNEKLVSELAGFYQKKIN